MVGGAVSKALTRLVFGIDSRSNVIGEVVEVEERRLTLICANAVVMRGVAVV